MNAVREEKEHFKEHGFMVQADEFSKKKNLWKSVNQGKQKIKQNKEILNRGGNYDSQSVYSAKMD